MSRWQCITCGKYNSHDLGRIVRKTDKGQQCNLCRYDEVPFDNKGFCPEQDRLDELRELSDLSAEHFSR